MTAADGSSDEVPEGKIGRARYRPPRISTDDSSPILK